MRGVGRQRRPDTEFGAKPSLPVEMHPPGPARAATRCRACSSYSAGRDTAASHRARQPPQLKNVLAVRAAKKEQGRRRVRPESALTCPPHGRRPASALW